jgi:CRP-like cAMP-binding protein
MTNKTDLIRASSLARELDEDQKSVLASLFESRDLSNGEVLIREGEISSTLYVIASGALEVTRDTGNGEWITLHLLRPGDISGELGFVDSMEHSATLRAVGSSQVLCLSRERFDALIDTHPKIVCMVMRAMVREVHAILRRMNVQYVEMTNYIGKQHGRY